MKGPGFVSSTPRSIGVGMSICQTDQKGGGNAKDVVCSLSHPAALINGKKRDLTPFAFAYAGWVECMKKCFHGLFRSIGLGLFIIPACSLTDFRQSATIDKVKKAEPLLVAEVIPSTKKITHEPKWDYNRGQGYVICDAVLKRLNHYRWTRKMLMEYSSLGRHVTMTYPGWKEPPWQELDPYQHKDLIRELIKYLDLGANVYFGRKPNPRSKEPTPQQREEQLRRVLDDGIRLRIWKTHLINWLNDKPAPPGNQTVVQLVFRIGQNQLDEIRKAYPDKPLIGWSTSSFIVTDDLKGLDPRVSDWHGHTLSGHSLVLFDGIPHYIGGSLFTITITRDFGSGPSDPFCILELKDRRK